MDLYKMGLRPTSPTRPITPDCPRNKHFPRFGMWQKLQHFFGRDGSMHCLDSDDDNSWPKPHHQEPPRRSEASVTRPVGVGLPRLPTFKRQNSEKRERLCPIEPCLQERRAYSMSRPRPTTSTRLRSSSVPTKSPPSRSATAIGNTCAIDNPGQTSFEASHVDNQAPTGSDQPVEYERTRPIRPPSITSSIDSFDDEPDYFEDRTQLNRELDTKWILNLSMHFRDKSDREKFFVTYAETPTRWRRVTVSCDYRNAEPGSLEMDLKELQLQRDKSMQIYEAIRESLLEIKFYDTVTNLKLETSDGRLHVHVTEDVNEIIPYPPVSGINHILGDANYRPRLIRESELSFEGHLSGFVYKVLYQNQPFIKKEIPGPDTVDEFLYEVNALHSLQDCQHVIGLEAIITDDSGQTIKGLLIDYAERGAVVDLLYDYKGEIAWEVRERWARHAIKGLSDIHEEGYVQGDFTLSNIVVDRDNNAMIIDINRRGCPVGWEPPEIAKKIASNQRISMYIGQKSDLYQLGMTLWALAMDDDEPERHDPPLSTQEFPAEVPTWYQDIVRNCLSLRPRDRLSATDLLKFFPPDNQAPTWSSSDAQPGVRIRTEKQYIDPATAVERDDIDMLRDMRRPSDEIMYSPESSREDYTFTYPRSSTHDHDYDSGSSELERPRGRRRISDYDLELQARRRHERTLAEIASANNPHARSAPIISLSSTDVASQFADIAFDWGQMSQEQNDMTEGGHTSVPPSPVISPPLSDRRLFPGQSEISDVTPRNSRFQLFPMQIYEPEDSTVPASSTVSMSQDIAGFGGHPNVSERSLEHIEQVSDEGGHDPLAAHPPSIPSHDSGYNEPSVFEIDFDDEAPVHNVKVHELALDSLMEDAPTNNSNQVPPSNEDVPVLGSPTVCASVSAETPRVNAYQVTDLLTTAPEVVGEQEFKAMLIQSTVPTDNTAITDTTTPNQSMELNGPPSEDSVLETDTHEADELEVHATETTMVEEQGKSTVAPQVVSSYDPSTEKKETSDSCAGRIEDPS